MALFAKLHARRAFERRHLPFVETIEDLDLVIEIGYHQERGTPLSMKQLYLLNVASIATMQRRLRRLKQLGAVQQRKSERDGRALELHISPKLAKTLARYLEIQGTPGTGG